MVTTQPLSGISGVIAAAGERHACQTHYRQEAGAGQAPNRFAICRIALGCRLQINDRLRFCRLVRDFRESQWVTAFIGTNHLIGHAPHEA